MLDFTTKPRLYCLMTGLFIGLIFCVGCRNQTAPERVYEQFVTALEDRNHARAWQLLSQTSRNLWNRAAHHTQSNGKALFVAGSLWRNRELRPDPKHPPTRKGNQALLTFFDELNQRVTVSLRKEKAGWRILLKGGFLKPAFPTPQPSTQSAPAPRLQPSSHPTTKALRPPPRPTP